MIELRHFRQFIAVAEELHYRKAAERLNMSQPPLTVTIQKLEAVIGATLLERGAHVIRLTPAGHDLLVHARKLVSDADDAVRSARSVARGRSGSLKIHYMGSALHGSLSEALSIFRKAYPDVRLQLVHATSTQAIDNLRRGDTDLGVVLPPLEHGDGLQTRLFDTDTLSLAIPKSHALAGRSDIDLADFAEDPFILWPAHLARSFHHRIVHLCMDHGFMPRIEQEVGQLHGLLALVGAGLGISIVPSRLNTYLSGKIEYVALDSHKTRFAYALCWRQDDNNVVLRNFIDCVP